MPEKERETEPPDVEVDELPEEEIDGEFEPDLVDVIDEVADEAVPVEEAEHEDDEEEEEALEELETEELELLDEEMTESLLVDEAAELRAIRREELNLTVDVQGVAPGEFVCQSCFLVKRKSQLADRHRMICRDCAS